MSTHVDIPKTAVETLVESLTELQHRLATGRDLDRSPYDTLRLQLTTLELRRPTHGFTLEPHADAVAAGGHGPGLPRQRLGVHLHLQPL